MTRPRPPIRLEFEPRFCQNHVVDLTVGCSFGCVYCPFSDLAARQTGLRRPTAVDLSNLSALPAPPTVFLSPGSDAFTPQAAPATHTLLAHLLPRGTAVGILTKGVIAEPTLDLLGRYASQVEGVVIGVSSLDDERNRLLEPGCPPARERLDNINRLAARGLPAALRLDPLFPLLDDDPSALERLVDEGARRGAAAITATYVFAWGRYLRRLTREPLLAASCSLLTEKAPMEGGAAFSVPLSRKLAVYSLLAKMAAQRGLRFNTCGCKDLRVRTTGAVPTVCRNSTFLEERGEVARCLTRLAAHPTPNTAARSGPPASPPA